MELHTYQGFSHPMDGFQMVSFFVFQSRYTSRVKSGDPDQPLCPTRPSTQRPRRDVSAAWVSIARPNSLCRNATSNLRCASPEMPLATLGLQAIGPNQGSFKGTPYLRRL
jgi:hypothetical protein